ncbi:MAG: TIGR01212 family radical SAM protein [Candidatus Omnitrophota bacterium]
MNNLYYSFGDYLKEKFGERVHRISLDAGFSCPNLDGHKSTQGCHYCNNKAFGVHAQSQKNIPHQIEESIGYYRRKLNVHKFIAYFQSFSNTYADCEKLKETYDVIKGYSEIVGLFISTRPDCVDREKLKLIADYQRDYLVWIEYGLQTTHDRILGAIGRNHSYEDFLLTLANTRAYGISVGVHMILGLPGQSEEDMLVDARRLGALDIQGIKFHALHVLRGTAFEELYAVGNMHLLQREEYIRIVCDYLEYLPAKVVILRLVSTARAHYLVAPAWVNDKSLVTEGIRRELERRGTRQGFRTARRSP